MSKRTTIKINTAYDMYRWYLAKMIKENEGFWVEYDSLIRAKGISILCKKIDGKKVVHMTYTCFRSILEKNNSKAKEAVIAGERYNLGNSLGYLLARRIERNFSKPKINVIATTIYRRNNPDNAQALIYHTDDDYCRIAWHKLWSLGNESVYEFKPAKDFRLSFSTAITNNNLLKYRYLFFPLLAEQAV